MEDITERVHIAYRQFREDNYGKTPRFILMHVGIFYRWLDSPYIHSFFHGYTDSIKFREATVIETTKVKENEIICL